METGSTDRVATYQSGNQTKVITVRYTIQTGDASEDLEYVSTSALTGKITDIDGAEASLILPSIGGGKSLSDNKDIVVGYYSSYSQESKFNYWRL